MTTKTLLRKLLFIGIIAIIAGSCTVDTTLVDPQGNEYKTVEIGDQIWITENLKFEVEEMSFCYKDFATECDTMGRLYTWDGAKKAAFEIPGWHLPSKAEWDELLKQCGSDSLAYAKMISIEFGFNPQWAGARLSSGKYIAKKHKIVNYWSSTTADTSDVLAYSVAVMSPLKKISPHNYPKKNACSVRLVKDKK